MPTRVEKVRKDGLTDVSSKPHEAGERQFPKANVVCCNPKKVKWKMTGQKCFSSSGFPWSSRIQQHEVRHEAWTERQKSGAKTLSPLQWGGGKVGVRGRERWVKAPQKEWLQLEGFWELFPASLEGISLIKATTSLGAS